MFEELKPCPFCGSQVDDGVRVICSRCGAGTKILVDMMTARGVSGDATKAVIEAWNRRADNG